MLATCPFLLPKCGRSLGLLQGTSYRSVKQTPSFTQSQASVCLSALPGRLAIATPLAAFRPAVELPVLPPGVPVRPRPCIAPMGEPRPKNSVTHPVLLSPSLIPLKPPSVRRHPLSSCTWSPQWSHPPTLCLLISLSQPLRGPGQQGAYARGCCPRRGPSTVADRTLCHH